MNKVTFFALAFVLISLTFGMACQTSPTSNSANTTSKANSNGRDMSNMNGHDMSKMDGHDMSNMSASGSSPNAASQPFDLQFIDSMVHHHDGAIKMAEMLVTKTQRPELKTFARKIIDDQKAEIAKLKGWREEWYPGGPVALNMELPGMKMSEMPMASDDDMSKMAADELDRRFFDMMIPHHEGAVKMSQEALTRAEHSEIKKLAEEIIREQQSEILQMQAWKKGGSN